MHPKELKYWLALQSVEGIGAATYLKLLDRFGTARDVFSASMADLTAIPRLPAPISAEILRVSERIEEMEKLILQLDDT
ncbi:MAG: helix-hairpin-helix domain-containing protein, partial [candidate division KSB1 bacterium]|nr:helix-hairpin-helix domain-containing protein [candidate division KSB1 bacterium]